MTLAKTLVAIGIIAAASTPLHAQDLTGTTVVITNTFQGAQIENVETDVTAFGLLNNRFATIGETVEFPDFITLYSVDIGADSIAFTWGDSAFARQLSGPTPDGNHDRNYLTFDLPNDTAITEVAFNADRSDLWDGSAAPTAQVIGPNRIVTDFSTGVIRGAGFNLVFSITLGTTE